MAGKMLLLTSCVCAFGLGYSLMPGFMTSARRMKSAIEIQEYLDLGIGQRRISHSKSNNILMWAKGFLRYLFRNGCGFAYLSAKLLAIPRVYKAIDAAYKLALWKGIECNHKSLVSLEIATCLTVSVMSLVMFGSLITTCSMVLITVGILQMYIMHQEAKREDVLRYQVPDAMRSLAACFHAGYSLPQAFLQTAEEVASPSKELFARVAHDVNMGISVHDALQTFKKSSGVPELAFVAVALDIQHVSGGSVGPILELAENSVMRSLELKRFLRTQTAQARFSARVVSGVPLVLVLALSATSPHFLTPFFQTFQGLALLVLAISLQVIGVVAIRRLLDVEVS